MTYGRTFTVVAYNDDWAQVYNGSSYGFTPRENLTRVDEAADDEDDGGEVVYETFRAVVSRQGARVYQRDSLSSASQPMTYGRTFTVVAYNDTWAQVYNGSSYGFTPRENLTRVDEAADDEDDGGEVVYETFQAVVSRQGARVYQRDSLSSASQPMTYGRTFTVVAYNDTWAQVYNGSSYGFTPRENLL